MLELLLRQLCVNKAMGYSAKTLPVTRYPVEVVPLLDSLQFLLYIQLQHLEVLPLFPRTCASPAYTSLVAYIVEGGTS